MKRFAEFILDPDEGSLWQLNEHGQRDRLDLPPRALDVLSYLALHAGKLVTHDELLDGVWRNAVMPEVIKAQILKIRQVLGDAQGSRQFIETVRGRGYRFLAPVTDAPALAAAAEDSHARLSGRTRPLEALREALNRVLLDQAQLILVSGESGIGKSALVNAFIDGLAPATGISVARGQCVEGFGGTEPFYPVLDALTRLDAAAPGDEIRDQIVAIAPTWATQLPAVVEGRIRDALLLGMPGAGRERMLREAGDLVVALSTRRPLVVVLEDLHWSDPSTIDLLSVIARRRPRCKLLVLATFRTDDVATSTHPVKQLQATLALQGLCSKIELGPLPPSAIGALLRGGVRSHPHSERLAEFISARVGGNPLFIMATLQHLAEQGLVEQDGGGWRLSAPLAPLSFEVPVTLQQVIEARLQRLDASQQEALRAASVAGFRFDAVTSAYGIDVAPTWMEDILEDLSRKALFIRREHAASRVAGPTTYQFIHAAIHDVVYSRQGAIRRAAVHARIGLKLEASLTSKALEASAGTMMRHFIAAEDWDRGLKYGKLALRTAKRRYAYRESLEILEIGMQLATHLDPDARRIVETELLESRASVYAAAHDARAADTYRAFIRAAEGTGNVDAQARGHLGLAYATSWQSRDECLEHLEVALALSEKQAHSPLRARTQLSARVWRIWAAGWDGSAAEACRVSLETLKAGDDASVTAWSSIEYAMLDLLASRYRAARTSVQHHARTLVSAVEPRSDLDVSRAIWMVRLGVPWASMLIGELGTALEEFDQNIRFFYDSDNGYRARTLGFYRAFLELHSLDFQAVLASCETLEADGVDGSDRLLPAEKRLSLLLRGLAHVGLHAHSRALGYLRQAERLMVEQPVIFDWYWKIPLEWGYAVVALAERDGKEATKRTSRLTAMCEAAEERTWQAIAFATLARAHLLTGDVAAAVRAVGKARTLIDTYEIPLARWRVARAAAAVARARQAGGDATEAQDWSDEELRALARSFAPRHRLRESLLRFTANREVRGVAAPDAVSRSDR